VRILGRALKAPQVRRAEPTSRTKFANILKVTHRDQVEPSISDWLREAYELQDSLAARPVKKPRGPARRKKRKR